MPGTVNMTLQHKVIFKEASVCHKVPWILKSDLFVVEALKNRGSPELQDQLADLVQGDKVVCSCASSPAHDGQTIQRCTTCGAEQQGGGL